jgi:hypothetical protein
MKEYKVISEIYYYDLQDTLNAFAGRGWGIKSYDADHHLLILERDK